MPRRPEIAAELALEVEFLTGVSVSATPHRRDEAEWPPHPDRLFQALVAAWGRNEAPLDDERLALEWLEQLDSGALRISSPSSHRRDVVPVFVPPNDFESSPKDLERLGWVRKWRAGQALSASDDKARREALGVEPRSRSRKERLFPAVVPSSERPLVRYIWRDADGLEGHRSAIARLAAEVTYLGHSHSLVRVALADAAPADSSGQPAVIDHAWIAGGSSSLRVPHPGRLTHLRERYASGRRPNPSLVTQELTAPIELPPHTLFDPETITVFADDGGFVPALEAFPLVAKRLRDALLAVAPKTVPVPSMLSGHDDAGNATREPHVAIVPLADVGWHYSQGRLLGLALLWPREIDRTVALTALVAFMRAGHGEVHLGRAGSWRIALEPESDRASLRVGRYLGPARHWATVLPAVLDRHPKARPGESVAAIVAKACFNAGLPAHAVDGLAVEIDVYGAVTGAPSVRAIVEALASDSPYRGRPIRHLVLTFEKPVAGPLVLGAGRFRGLGLCLPLDDEVAS